MSNQTESTSAGFSRLRSKRALSHLAAGLLALAIVPPIGAQTKSGKKPAHAEEVVTDTNDAGVKSKSVSQATTKAKKPASESEGSPSTKPSTAPNATIAAENIREFPKQPASVQKLIEASLALAGQNLTYTFGSADPANGGMDCSGFIHYVLRQQGLTDVPRDSSGLYTWVRKAHTFYAVISRTPNSFELDELLPGDLLFWTGTYATAQDPPITHTMIYLGTEKSGRAKIMVGSSDGRTYRGQKRNGVSVFDFKMPRKPGAGEQGSTFVGYARIPGLRD